MQIPQPNINAYRKWMKTPNFYHQLPPTLCNDNKNDVNFTGTQFAFINSNFDEGTDFRGYGCYRGNAPCNLCNIYCPLYYNSKSSVKANNAWFV